MLSEIVAQLVADARRQEGLSMDELADRAGVHRTYIGLLERRSRQPTLAVAANLAEALGLSLSELVAEAEQDVGHGTAPEVELLPARRRRRRATRMGRGVQLTAMTGLTTGMIARAIELAYRKLDLIDDQIRESGSPALAGLVDLPDLSLLVANVLSAGLAQASNGLYVQNVPDHSPQPALFGTGSRSWRCWPRWRPTGRRVGPRTASISRSGTCSPTATARSRAARTRGATPSPCGRSGSGS